MAVAFNSETHTNGDANSFTFSHTPAGSNRVLIVDVAINRNADIVTGVTFNSVPLTNFASVVVANAVSSRWYLINPDATPANVVVTMSATEKAVCGARTYTGVDQTTPLGYPRNITSGGDTALTVPALTQRNDSMLVGHAAWQDIGTVSASTGTQRYADVTSGNPDNSNEGGCGADSLIGTTGGFLFTFASTVNGDCAVDVIELYDANPSTATALVIDNFAVAADYNTDNINTLKQNTDNGAALTSATSAGGEITFVVPSTGDRFFYSKVSDTGWCYDGSAFDSYRFKVKRTTGSGDFNIEGEYYSANCTTLNKPIVDIASYITLSTDYQTVTLPFADFSGHDVTRLSAIVIVWPDAAAGTFVFDDFQLVNTATGATTKGFGYIISNFN